MTNLIRKVGEKPGISQERLGFIMQKIVTGRVIGVYVEDPNYEAKSLELQLSDGRFGTIPLSEVGFKLPNKTTGRRIAKRFLGRTMIAKITQDNPLILSNKAAIEEKRQSLDLQEGQVIEGTIVGISTRELTIEYQSCITLILPASEYSIAKKASLRHSGLTFGDKLQVQIKEIKNNEVIVTRKPLIRQSWVETANKYEPRNQYLGTVVNIIREGAFVNLEPGLDMLCSPLPPFIDLETGDEVSVEIRNVNIEAGRIKGTITAKAMSA